MGYCAVTGVVPTQFTPIYRHGEVTDVALRADIEAEVQWIESLETLPSRRFDGDWFIPLIGQNELYGFYKFFQTERKVPTVEMLDGLALPLEELSDHNYTRRVQFLSEPFSVSNGAEAPLSESATGKNLTHLTALSFGADGAVFRTYDARSELLRVVEFEGEMPDELISERRNGELLSGAVVCAGDFGWSVVEISPKVSIRGCKISPESIEQLRRLGVRAAISARLDDPRKFDGPPLGTLTYFFNRPNRFSWRDVTLFLAFAKRAADAIALTRETSELSERNMLIENQSRTFTQAEVATLLVHDIAHKVFHVGELGETLIDVVKRQLRSYRAQVPTEIGQANVALRESIDVLQKEVQDLRVVGKLTDADSAEFGPKTFSLRVVVDDLFKSMQFPLSRYGISPRNEVPGEIKIHGSIRVLHHILLNLLLNTIDAVKERGRAATVHVALASQNSDYVTIKFWDTGPGLNLSRLSSANEIFKIGKTTKGGGTGLGLPMSRNLLARYFHGSLNLVDSKAAVFEIELRKWND
jgi:signal transduction histidine kinase